jgi:phosphatidate cytidylyltransferase
MASRVASALGLALVALAATALGGVAFALVWSCAASLFFAEFLAMVGYRPLFVGRALGAVGMVAAALGLERGLFLGSLGALGLTALVIAFRAEAGKGRFLGVAGLLYGACVALPVILLRSDPKHGLALTLWLYALVWVTDIGAFFVGRGLGGPKLWKRVSPNKTWSGFLGGTLFGVGAALLLNRIFPAVELAAVPLICLTILGSLAAHGGDLLESALKRRFGVKDSSQLIPGHGGFMDRLDGFAFASLFVAAGLQIIG